MPPAPISDSLMQTEIAAVYDLYAAVARDLDPESGLGGKLLYAGELNDRGCRLVRAANIAGAASLSATSDALAQRRAIREGVVDFLVTSLDEALRILKNEVRKRQAVSVAVSLPPAAVESEMLERGVAPDLLPPQGTNTQAGELVALIALGGRRIEVSQVTPSRTLFLWKNVSEEFESLAIAELAEEDHANRRWVRLSPRYLGPGARRVRSLACDPDAAARLAARLNSQPL